MTTALPSIRPVAALFAATLLLAPATLAQMQLTIDPSPQAEQEVTAWLKTYEGFYALPDGARLHVQVAGRGLVVTAEGQQAVNTLRIAPPAEAENLLQRNGQAATILSAWANDDLAPLREALPKHRRTRAEADLTRLMNLFVKERGEILKYEVFGTVPFPNERTQTFARVTFAGGTEVLRFLWKGDRLVTFNRHLLPAFTVQALPVAGDRFVVTGRFDEHPAWIAFDVNYEGTATALTVRGSGGERTARRADSLAER